MYGVYKISFKSDEKAGDLSHWIVQGQWAEAKFEDKDSALRAASEKRFYDRDDRSNSRLRNLGMWKTRYYVKPCTLKGRAKLPGMVKYIMENYTDEKYRNELLEIWRD